MTEDHNEEEEMIINQEFKIWKKSAPYFFDFSLIRSLQWPSSTFQWIPESDADQFCYNHYAYICSNNLDGDLSELQKIKIKIPKENKTQNYIKAQQAKVEIIQRNVVGSQINRARYCQARSDLVATTHANRQILLSFKGETCYKLNGHTNQGYGLSWNPIKHSYLASGNTDKHIMIWDVEKTKAQNNKIQPIIQIKGGQKSAPVQDVAWHKMHPNILGSCSGDRLIMLWDIRSKSASKQASRKPIFQIIAHTNQIYSLDFNPFNQFLMLSGSADENVSVWDIRNLTRSVQTLETQGSVIKVQWSPHSMNLFASCGYDHKVYIWDLSTMSTANQFSSPLGTKKQQEIKGKQQRQKVEKQKGLIFTHEGHRSKVVDFDWNLNERLLIGSIEEANCLHAWQMKKQLYYGEINN